MILEAATFCLAVNLYHEGLKDEPLEGLFAIAQVQLNRAGRKPENICAITKALGQFTWTKAPPDVENGKPWRNAASVAQLSFHMNDFTGGANHYHALYVSPYWRPHMELRGMWGSHLFYKDPKFKVAK